MLYNSYRKKMHLEVYDWSLTGKSVRYDLQLFL